MDHIVLVELVALVTLTPVSLTVVVVPVVFSPILPETGLPAAKAVQAVETMTAAASTIAVRFLPNFLISVFTSSPSK